MRGSALIPALGCALLLGAAASASAELCKYVDDTGHVTYSDSAVKGAKKSGCFEAAPPPPPPPPVAQPAARGAPAQQANVSPGTGLPNVDPATQRKRDDSRRKILEDELAVEERALVDARKALSEGEASRLGDERNYQRYLDRVQGLKERVTQHERNVAALKQELTKVR